MENFIISIGNALGWSILHSIWQAAIWFIVYSAYTMLNSQISAKTKHNAAFGTQIGIFISFVFTFIYFYQSSQEIVDFRNFNPQELKILMENINQGGFRIESLLPYVVAGYIFGFIIQLLLLSNSLIKLKTLKYKGLDSVPNKWIDLYLDAKKKLNVRQAVGIYLSNKISVPITLGHVRPFILFPIAYANQMDLAQVEAIILHELAHVKRQDYLFNLLKVGIETIMFFNPFIWALSKVVEREREHACDDMVVEHISTPISYAQALIELEELRMSLNPALTMAATGNKNHLLNRIKRITKMETNYKNVRPQLFAVLLSGIALVTLAFILPIQESNAQEIKNKKTNTKKNVQIDTVKFIEPEPSQPAIEPIKPKSKLSYQGNIITDTTELPLEVRKTLRSIENQSKEIEAKFNSAEWKNKMATIESQSKEIEAKFNSAEWKNQISKIEENSKEISKYFESEDFKNQMSKIEKESKKVNQYFESPEWAARVKKIEENGKKINAYFESKEWKDKMENINKNAANVDKYFNSPEWKEKVKQIELDAKKIQDYFNSPEWKKKQKEMEELQNSPEYQEINKRYQKEVDELKQKKGLSKI